MKSSDSVTRRQLAAVGFVSLFAPMIRRFPRAAVLLAGRTAWLAAPLAAIPLAAVLGLWALLLCRKTAGAGFQDILRAVFGKALGKGLVLLYGLWFVFYAGFSFRSGAARFVSTVYPGAGPWVFILCSLPLGALAAMGGFRVLGRCAMVLRPLLFAVPALLLILSLKELDMGLLLPVTRGDLLPNGRAALEIANLLGVAGYLAFAGDRAETPFRMREFAVWDAALLAVVGGITAVCLGMFGPALTEKLAYPLFMLARDTNALGALERMEPLILAIWIFSDFVLITAMLWLAGRNLRFVFSLPEPEPGQHVGDFRRGRWTGGLCTALSFAAALAIPEDFRAFYRISEFWVPCVNAVMAFALPALTLLVGKLRRRV